MVKNKKSAQFFSNKKLVLAAIIWGLSGQLYYIKQSWGKCFLHFSEPFCDTDFGWINLLNLFEKMLLFSIGLPALISTFINFNTQFDMYLASELKKLIWPIFFWSLTLGLPVIVAFTVLFLIRKVLSEFKRV